MGASEKHDAAWQGTETSCECGDTTGPFVRDLSGGSLCADCAAESAVPCTICGDDAPVKLYDETGALDPDSTLGTPAYFAACRICDHATEEDQP